MRVVIDTNVLVSRFLSPTGPPAHLFDYWDRQSFEVVASEPILAEYRRALLYERVAARHGLTAAGIDELIEQIRQFHHHRLP